MGRRPLPGLDRTFSELMYSKKALASGLLLELSSLSSPSRRLAWFILPRIAMFPRIPGSSVPYCFASASFLRGKSMRPYNEAWRLPGKPHRQRFPALLPEG